MPEDNYWVGLVCVDSTGNCQRQVVGGGWVDVIAGQGRKRYCGYMTWKGGLVQIEKDEKEKCEKEPRPFICQGGKFVCTPTALLSCSAF